MNRTARALALLACLTLPPLTLGAPAVVGLTATQSPAKTGTHHPVGVAHGAPVKQVLIEAPWLYDHKTRYAHSLPEIYGPTVTLTTKTTVVDLDRQPPIVDNHERELFDRLPGIVLAEQQNPVELNLSYRGLGNPQESEYILVMQDGIPLEMDWIGYPTLYDIPVPQSIASVQMIRGGSGLLYGPEPEPVINFVSRQPGPKLAAESENVGGSDGLFSTYESISGPAGRWDYLADFSHRQSHGQRENGDYDLVTGDAQLGYRIGSGRKLKLAVHAYSLQSGMAGLMSYAQFKADPNQTTTPQDRDWAHRYTAVLTYQDRIDARDLLVQKLWTGYQDLVTRADSYTNATLPAATGAQLASQKFHYTGLDGRFLHRWSHGSAVTVGYTAYASDSPYIEVYSTDAQIAPYGEAGTPFYNDQRRTRYAAVFAQGLFRFGRFHLVTNARLDHETLRTREFAAPHPLLADASYDRNIPLFGIGIGNDFGRGNETYLNVSQAYRPLRYLDIASPFSDFSPTNSPDPTKYVTYEGGVHGWPLPGVYYDASVFQVNARNRVETEHLTATESIDVNTGNTRSRGIEMQGSFDLLRLLDSSCGDRHLTLFANAAFLNAKFTGSIIPGQIGKTPAYAPRYVLKAGLTYRQSRHFDLSLVVDSVAEQFMQDSDLAAGSTPAEIPTYTVADFSGEYRFSGHWRITGGVSNLTDRRYYSRVFLFGGLLEPALSRQVYAGIIYDL